MAVKFHSVTSNSVARIVGNGIVILGLGAVVTLLEVGHIVRVAERAVVDGVLNAGVLLATQKVVDGAVLHAQQDDILDLVLKVLDRGLRTWLDGLGTKAGEG